MIRRLFVLIAVLSALPLTAQMLATINVSKEPSGPVVPDDFLGFSVELSSVSRFFGSSASDSNAVLLNLIENLGQGTLPIGGNSQDEYCWAGATPPQPALCTNTTSLNLQLLESLFKTSQATNWPLLMGLNLAQNSGSYAEDEILNGILPAQQAEGGRLLGLEIGNEIDLYSPPRRPSPYTAQDQVYDVLGYITTLKSDLQTESLRRVAPAYSNYTVSKLEGMLPDFLSGVLGPDPTNLGLITIHAYPTNVCTSGTTVTAAQLLSPSMITKVQQGFEYALSQVQPYGLQLQMGETNSTACSGQNGVSNAQAAALWGLDHMLSTAQLGVRRMNFHLGGTSYYNPVQTASSSGSFTNQVQPLYYAMYLFQAAKRKLFLPVTINSVSNVSAYALSDCPNCTMYVYVINKDLSASGTVSIVAPKAPKKGNATALALSAPSVSSLAADVTLGGVEFSNSTGELAGAPQTSTVAPDDNGVYTFSVANATAVLVAIRPLHGQCDHCRR